MPNKRLTELAITKTKPPATGRLDLWDTTLPGFGLRITATGARSYVIALRRPGSRHPTRFKLGSPEVMTLAEARDRARQALLDPAAFFAARTPAAPPPEQDTVASVLQRFIDRHQRPRNRSWQEVARVLGKALEPWATRPIADITKPEMIELIDATAARAPVLANRLRAHLLVMFAWAVEREILVASPVAGIRPPTREASRDRVLEPEELIGIWRACDTVGWPFGAIVRLLILLGQRRTEVCRMRWADVDLAGRMWRLPGEATKTGVAHDVPLPPLALEILNALPRFANEPWVFPSTKAGRPFRGYSAGKTRLDKLSGVSGWRLHDLRRTMATGLQRLGTPLEVTEAVLGHTSGSRSGIVSVYQRHHFGPEKRRALDAWSREVERLLGTEALVITIDFPARKR